MDNKQGVDGELRELALFPPEYKDEVLLRARLTDVFLRVNKICRDRGGSNCFGTLSREKNDETNSN